MERLVVPVHLGNREFRFDLCRREIELVPNGLRVMYYWMDSSALRRGGKNHRACVDFWWTCMESDGCAYPRAGQTAEEREESRLLAVCLVLAELYPLVARSKGMQRVVEDAYLRTQQSDDAPALEPEEVQRLRTIATGRNTAAVSDELHNLFVSEMPPSDGIPAFQRRFEGWTGQGVEALGKDGRTGLSHYVHNVLGPEIARYRKRGGEPRWKQFLDWMSYFAKESFYVCFANAWVGLIPVIREKCGLDSRSELLLRLMHCRTKFEVFKGQVLSLHPLSALLMSRPEHLLAVARYVESDPRADGGSDADKAANPVYWDFVAAVLIAGHEYKRVKQQSDLGRRQRANPEPALAQAARDEAEADVARVLECFAARRGLRCLRGCAAPLAYAGYERSATGDVVNVTFQCRDCQTKVEIVVHRDELRSFDTEEPL